MAAKAPARGWSEGWADTSQRRKHLTPLHLLLRRWRLLRRHFSFATWQTRRTFRARAQAAVCPTCPRTGPKLSKCTFFLFCRSHQLSAGSFCPGAVDAIILAIFALQMVEICALSTWRPGYLGSLQWGADSVGTCSLLGDVVLISGCLPLRPLSWVAQAFLRAVRAVRVTRLMRFGRLLRPGGQVPGVTGARGGQAVGAVPATIAHSLTEQGALQMGCLLARGTSPPCALCYPLEEGFDGIGIAAFQVLAAALAAPLLVYVDTDLSVASALQAWLTAPPPSAAGPQWIAPVPEDVCNVMAHASGGARLARVGAPGGALISCTPAGGSFSSTLRSVRSSLGVSLDLDFSEALERGARSNIFVSLFLIGAIVVAAAGLWDAAKHRVMRPMETTYLTILTKVMTIAIGLSKSLGTPLVRPQISCPGVFPKRNKLITMLVWNFRCSSRKATVTWWKTTRPLSVQ